MTKGAETPNSCCCRLLTSNWSKSKSRAPPVVPCHSGGSGGGEGGRSSCPSGDSGRGADSACSSGAPGDGPLNRSLAEGSSACGRNRSLTHMPGDTGRNVGSSCAGSGLPSATLLLPAPGSCRAQPCSCSCCCCCAPGGPAAVLVGRLGNCPGAPPTKALPASALKASSPCAQLFCHTSSLHASVRQTGDSASLARAALERSSASSMLAELVPEAKVPFSVSVVVDICMTCRCTVGTAQLRQPRPRHVGGWPRRCSAVAGGDGHRRRCAPGAAAWRPGGERSCPPRSPRGACPGAGPCRTWGRS